MKTIFLKVGLFFLFCSIPFRLHGAEQNLRVCATVPELGSLIREVAGDQVSVIVFAKGTEDAHFVEAKPSFIKDLSQADLFVEMGMELEIGWAPVLLQNARNARVLPGAPGFLDVSAAITPLGQPKGFIDRAMGDVHPAGNPHFLLDPVNGIAVARLIRERLSELRPGHKADFDKGYEQFRKKMAVALVGEKLAGKYDVEKLALLADHHKLEDFLKNQGETSQLAGWLGAMRPYVKTQVVVDHNLWLYFSERFGLTIVGSLEPKPGLQPTTRHLGKLVNLMKEKGVKIVLSSSYYDPRHARFIAEKTGARILAMAHQVGSRPGTDDYFSMIDYDVKQVTEALANLGRQE